MAMAVAIVSVGMCNDKRPDCSNWARDGECAGDNSVSSRPASASAAQSRKIAHCVLQSHSTACSCYEQLCSSACCLSYHAALPLIALA